jgi:hypothetical protein
MAAATTRRAALVALLREAVEDVLADADVEAVHGVEGAASGSHKPLPATEGEAPPAAGVTVPTTEPPVGVGSGSCSGCRRRYRRSALCDALPSNTTPARITNTQSWTSTTSALNVLTACFSKSGNLVRRYTTCAKWSHGPGQYGPFFLLDTHIRSHLVCISSRHGRVRAMRSKWENRQPALSAGSPRGGYKKGGAQPSTWPPPIGILVVLTHPWTPPQHCIANEPALTWHSLAFCCVATG